MLPKPNFNSSPANPVLSGTSGQTSGQNWFQYNPNQSLNPYLNNNYANHYGNGYNTFANNYPQNQANYWTQNNSNPANLWSGYQNQMNAGLNLNYGQFNGQSQYQRNGFQNNKRFKNFDTNSSDRGADVKTNQFNRNKSFNCDTCCRWFTSQEQYDQHISEHVMCGLDECTFRAHPKVIESHQRMQHFCFRDKTLVKKFMSLETKEDIDKWREERRKKFPTKDNIKRKEESVKQIDKKRKSDVKEDNECNTKEGSDGEKVEVKQNSERVYNKRNKRKNTKIRGKGQERPTHQTDRQNNRKLTLFQKLMSMDEEKEELKNDNHEESQN